MKKRAVCILSGGMDSTLASYIAKNEAMKLLPFILIMDKGHKIES